MTNIDTALVERARELLAAEWGDHPQWATVVQRIRTGSCSVHSDTLSLSCSLAIDAIVKALQSTREKKLEEALEQLLDDMGEDGLCVCQQAKDEAIAALSDGEREALPVGGEWRDIASAPKDGSLFLGAQYCPELASPFSNPTILPWIRRVIWWDPEFEQTGWDDKLDEPNHRGAWCSGRVASWGGEAYAEEHPTHWMPLPPPPTQQPAVGEESGE